MPPIGNLSHVVIGSAECGRVEEAASRAGVSTLKYFRKEISAENVFALIAGVARRIGTMHGGKWTGVVTNGGTRVISLCFVYTPIYTPV